MDIFDIAACPKCGKALQLCGSSLRCEGGHSYDIAKSSYVNLLPPGKLKNAVSGDDREMLRSRSAFLSGGYYDKISDTAADILLDCADSDISFIDAGCGEGYHTMRIVRRLLDAGRRTIAFGIDASKHGADMAARLAKRSGLCGSAYFAAGNIFSMPVHNNSVKAVFSIFAPVAGEECARVLKDDGVLIVVSAGREHLRELREIIYDKVEYKDSGVRAPDGFEIIAEQRLTDKAALRGSETIANLFCMTPFFYRAPATGRAKLVNINCLDITVDVNYTVMKPRHGGIRIKA